MSELNDGEFELKVREWEPQDLESALSVASRLEAYEKSCGRSDTICEAREYGGLDRKKDYPNRERGFDGRTS